MRAAFLTLALLLCLAAPAVAQVEVEELPEAPPPESEAPPPAEAQTPEAAPQPPPPAQPPTQPAPTTPPPAELDARALEAQAEERYADGDLEGAAVLYRQAAERAESTAERVRLLVVLASLEHQLGRPDGAVKALTEVLLLQPEYTLDEAAHGRDFVDVYFEAKKRATDERHRQSNDRLREALEKLAAGDQPAARKHLQEGLALRPNAPELLYNLALLDQREGKADAAIAGFQKLMALRAAAPGEISPELQVQTLNSLGILYYERGFNEDAEAALAEASTLDPNQSKVWNNLGLARRKLGKRQEATEAFRRAHELDPADDAALNNLALAYIDAANWTAAAALLAEGTARAPQNAGLWFNLGVAKRGLGDLPGAAEALRQAITADAGNQGGVAARSASYLALVLYEQGDAAAAAAAAQRAIEQNGDDVQAWTYLGLAQQAQGDLDGARTSLEKAAGLDPTSAEIANNLGSTYFRLGDYAKAETAFQRSLTLRPDFLAATENIAQARRRLAELATLRDRLGLVVATRPKPPGARAGLAIESVVPGSPAALAEIVAGDLVVGADGNPVLSLTDVVKLLERTPPPKALGVELWRAGKVQREKIRLQ
jgi:tetratricopeptide (TPR) repeat protein